MTPNAMLLNLATFFCLQIASPMHQSAKKDVHIFLIKPVLKREGWMGLHFGELPLQIICMPP
jgi:hypothetical protein